MLFTCHKNQLIELLLVEIATVETVDSW